MVGTYLQERGHEVKIYDADKPLSNCKSLTRTEVMKNYPFYSKALENEEHPIWNEIKEKITEFHPQVVGLTSITAKIDSANKIAKMSKELFNEDVEVILGGPHVQGMRQMYPNYDFGPHYNYIVTHIPNLVDRTPDKTLIIDHEEYPIKDFLTMSTLTGCPNSCTFCCNSGRNKKIVYRNLRSIEEELDSLKKNKGKNLLTLLDDCFFSNERRFNEVGQLINKYGFEFIASARIMALSPNKIDDFIKNGGRKISVGIESGSQKVLDLMQKKLKIEETIKRTKWLKEFEISWMAFLMAGLPFETVEDLKLTEELVYKIKPTFVSLNRFVPYPGTKIWEDYYMDTDLNFKDLYQLNPAKKIENSSPEIEEQIEKMFDNFDKYNQEQNKII